MKTKSIITLIAVILALVFCIGSIAVLASDTPGGVGDVIGDVIGGGNNDDPPATDPVACAHETFQAVSLMTGADGKTTFVDLCCVKCGDYHELLDTSSSHFDKDFSFTLTSKNVPVFASPWSVGSWNNTVTDDDDAYIYEPFNSVSANGDWLCHDGEEWMNKNCFRVGYDGNILWSGYYRIGLGIRPAVEGGTPPTYDVAITYDVKSDGYYKISAGSLLVGDYSEVYDFNVCVDGKPIFEEWIRVGNPNQRDDIDVSFIDSNAFNALLAERAAERGYDINAFKLKAGSQLSFVARYVQGTVDQASFLPYVEWVRSSGSYAECADGCHLYNDTTCRICGHTK